MNETITTLSDLPEDEQTFAYIIFEIIKDKYEKEYQTGKESKRVPLEDIKFQSQDFWDYTIMMTGLSIVQEYNSNQKWNQNWKAIAERMLERLYCLRFFRPLPNIRLCYNTISLKGVSNGETKNLHP